MSPEPGGGYGSPPDQSPQKPGESWSDYWARVHRNSNSGKARYPWGNDAWPGADKSDDKHTDRTELVSIAKSLRQDLENFFTGGASTGGSGSKTKPTSQLLSDTYGISPTQVGAGSTLGGRTWDVAHTFHGTLDKSRQSMIDAHDAFVASFEDVIRRVEKAAGISQNAEEQSQAAVNNPSNKTDQTY